jgi:hypothetical protein
MPDMEERQLRHMGRLGFRAGAIRMTSLRSTITKADVADKLREARALIEKGWTQDYFAKDAKGRPDYYDPSSPLVCYCSLGAISTAVRGYPDADANVCEVREYENFLAKAIGKSGPVGIAEWNDDPDRTQAEVLAAFDKAIELAEQSA